MRTRTDKSQETQSRAVANQKSRKRDGSQATFQFVDNRPEAKQLARLQEMAKNSPQAANGAPHPYAVAQRKQFERTFGQPAQREEAPQEDLQMKAGPGLLQRQGEEGNETFQAKFEPAQKEENKTGMPDNLKSGIENLSGTSLDDVNVHYNSSKPTELQALAFTQGTDIHVGSGQERHLAHEAWHVVQQSQGRVKPTIRLQGTSINDDVGLEHEADVMGARASRHSAGQESMTNELSGKELQMKAEPKAKQAPKGDPALGSAISESVQRLTSRQPGTTLKAAPGVIQRAKKVVKTIEGVDVRIRETDPDQKEEKEAKRIILKLKNEYGIELKSQVGIDAIKQDYTKVADNVKQGLSTKVFYLKELVALEQGLGRYKDILGATRGQSPLSGEEQEVTSVSKMEKSIPKDVKDASLSAFGDLGEYFHSKKNFTMFQFGVSKLFRLGIFFGKGDFNNLADQLEGTVVHEAAHGIYRGEERYFTASGVEFDKTQAIFKRLTSDALAKVDDDSFMSQIRAESGASDQLINNIKADLKVELPSNDLDASVFRLKIGAKYGKDKEAKVALDKFEANVRTFSESEESKKPASTDVIDPAYWDNKDKKTENKNAEEPVTSYAKKNPSEDMAETAMFFFKKPNALKSKQPQRYNIFTKLTRKKGIKGGG